MVWRMEALQIEAWDHTAWICLHMPSFSKSERKFESFHPLRKSRQTTDIASMNAWVDEVATTLPKTLTREEIDRRWEEHLKNGG